MIGALDPGAAPAPRPPPEDQRLLFHGAAGLVRAAELRPALGRGRGDPSAVALPPCACGLGAAACVCLGYSPLHAACQRGRGAVVQMLLEADADVHVRSARLNFGLGTSTIAVDGMMPLHVAAACGHRCVVEMLLKFAADPLVGAKEPPKTPLGFALMVAQGPVVELLQSAVAERKQAIAAAAEHQPDVTLVQYGTLRWGGDRLDAVRRRVRARLDVGAASAAATQEAPRRQPVPTPAAAAAAAEPGRGAGDGASASSSSSSSSAVALTSAAAQSERQH